MGWEGNNYGSNNFNQHKRKSNPGEFWRFLISSRATGSVIGKGGDKIKAMRTESGAQVRCIGDDMPERILKIGGNVEQVTQVIGMLSQNLFNDYKDDRDDRKPARKMARQQKHPSSNDIQICMLLCEPLIGPIVGKGGSNIKQMEENHRVQINVWKSYSSGDFLPNSNERVIAFTGPPDCVPNAVGEVASLVESTEIRGQMIEFDLEEEGPSGFFGEEGGSIGRNGAGLKGNRPGNSVFSRGELPPGVSPFLQKMPEERDGDCKIRLKVNNDQAACIIGGGGRRVNEIRKMSGADIKIRDNEGDSCMRFIEVFGHEPQQALNAVWLMNIAINAFCEEAASLRPLHKDMPMETVATSGAYGNPPGLEMSQSGVPPQQGFGGPPQQGFGGPPQQGFGGPPQQGFGGPPQAYQNQGQQNYNSHKTDGWGGPLKNEAPGW